jgi:hypothetical protein
MSSERVTLINIIARTASPDIWKLVLIEAGPWWPDDLKDELYRIQDRLYGCIDAAIDGQLAEKFPDTIGKHIIIKLICVDIADQDIIEFFNDFSNVALSLPDYKNALSKSKFVSGISFEIEFNTSE